jgi:hypothetical protein
MRTVLDVRHRTKTHNDTVGTGHEQDHKHTHKRQGRAHVRGRRASQGG